MARALAILLVTALSAPPLAATDGALDTTFQAPDGYAVTSSSQTGAAAGGALAPDGAAVALTRMSANTIAWARVPETGPHTPCSYAPPGATVVLPAAVTFDAAGRLLLTGSAFYPSLGWVVFVARALYPACSLDPAFDGDGYVTVDAEPGSELFGLAIATTRIFVQSLPVERIVVGGEVRPGPGPDDGADLLLVRLRGNGSLDPGFGGGDGWARYDFDAQSNSLAALAIDDAGRIVLGGTVDLVGDSPDPMVVRALPDGTLDGTFGSFGWARLAYPEAQAVGGMALEADGTIWLAAREVRAPAPTDRLVIVKLGAGGASSVGVGGWYVDGSLAVAGAVRQGDGRLIVYGDRIWPDGNRDLFVTACRSAPPQPCVWETSFGPLDAAGFAYPLPDLAPDGDEAAAGMVLAGGRPLLFFDAEVDQAGRRLGVARLSNGYIFADSFESTTTRRWLGQ